MTDHRIRITIRRDATGAHMLSMARTTPPWQLGAQRQTRAECDLVAKYAMAAFERDGPGADVIAAIHAAERAAQSA